jgi:hypothetical protein
LKIRPLVLTSFSHRSKEIWIVRTTVKPFGNHMSSNYEEYKKTLFFASKARFSGSVAPRFVEKSKGDVCMKGSRLSTIAILFAGSLLLSTTTLAGNINKKTLHLYEKAKVLGTLLNPGDYKVEWSGSGPNIQLNILQGRDTVATVPARVVTENTSNPQDGYILQPSKSGGQSIEEIFFSGTKYDLKIQPAGNASSGSSHSGTNR